MPRPRLNAIWERHVMRDLCGRLALSYIDRNLFHDLSRPPP
jgi:hypothetical protein